VSYRVLRGGSFSDNSWFLLTSVRDGSVPEYRYWAVGFRVASKRRKKQ
jgi:formylglycine-generating enzyme required for sulfatase activity